MHLLLALSLAASASLAQSRPPRDAPSLRVYIDSDSPKVELFRVTGEGIGTVATGQGVGTVGIIQFQRECHAPCDTHILEPRDDFFIAGSGITPSDRFSLLDQGPDVTLRVNSGSRVLRFLGVTSLTLGITSIITGATFLLVGGLDSDDEILQTGGDNFMKNVGRGALIGGGVLLGAGIPLMAFSSTDVEFLPNRTPDTTRQTTRL